MRHRMAWRAQNSKTSDAERRRGGVATRGKCVANNRRANGNMFSRRDMIGEDDSIDASAWLSRLAAW